MTSAHDKIDAMPGKDTARQLSRRGALSAIGTGILISCAGCGVRREADAPAIPGLSTQSPPVDRDVLLNALADERAAVAATPPRTAIGAALHAAHTAQVAKLVDVIAGLGIQPSTPAVSGSSDLAQLERQNVTTARIAAAQGAELGHRPMLAAILALRCAGASILNKPVFLAGALSPSPASAIQVLPTVREAVYAFETITAKTPLAERAIANATLKFLYATRSRWDQAAGDAAGAEPLGYALPTDLDTAQGRTALARHLLTQLISVTAAQSSRETTNAHLAALIDLWHNAVVESWRWGTTAEAFPGLRNP